MKFPKAIRVIYTATLLAVGVLVASTFPQWTPERIGNLPGRQAGIMAPTVTSPVERTGPPTPTVFWDQVIKTADGGIRFDIAPRHHTSFSAEVLSVVENVTGWRYVALSGLQAAHSPKLSNATANLAADTVAALFNSCYLKIYDGTQAATADTSIGAQVLLATLRCNATAFGSASAGLATANAITSDTDAAATGTAAWFRVLKSDNSTVVMDGSVGTSGADINLATVSIAQHATVSVTSFTYQQAKS